MIFFELKYLKKVFVITSVIFCLCLLFLLIGVNHYSRKSIDEVAKLQSDISKYKDDKTILEREIATYSAILKIEKRAKELDYGKYQNLEYLE